MSRRSWRWAVAMPILVSCGQDPGPIETRPHPETGWEAAYESHVRESLADYPELLKIDADRTSDICSNFASLGADKRRDFFVAVVYALAGAETDFRRTVSYSEPSLGTDPVTGRGVRSEGLLQLSYQDRASFSKLDDRADRACAFDFEADRSLFQSDLVRNATKVARGSFLGSSERSILNAYRNLSCGVFIVNLQVTRLNKSRSFLEALGRYWAVARPQSARHEIFLKHLREKSPCE
mgnify:CR=1 FL=1